LVYTNSSSHSALAAAILIGLTLLGYQITSNVLFIMIFLLGAIAPDLDLILGLGSHRKGTHTLLFAGIFGFLMVYVTHILVDTLQANTVFALLAVILCINVVYYKGRLKRSINAMIWVAILASIMAFELGGFGTGAAISPLADNLIFIAASGGCCAHLIGDFIAASWDSRMKILWPLQYRFGVRIIKTGGWSERVLYGLMVTGIFYVICTQGAYVSPMLAALFAKDYLAGVLAISFGTGLIAAWTSATPSREFDLIR